MTTKAHDLFASTHARGLRMVTSSVELWQVVEDSNSEPTIEQYNASGVIADMGRAGVVIGVSAFDDYFTRRFSECVVPIIKSGNAKKPLINFLDNCGLDVSEALSLLTMERPYRRIRKLVDDHLEKKTTQRFDAIDKLFKCVGLQTLSAQVEKEANRSTLKRSCEIIVARRHAIAHQGDLNKHGNLTRFSYKDAKKRLADLKLFVDTANTIVTKNTT